MNQVKLIRQQDEVSARDLQVAIQTLCRCAAASGKIPPSEVASLLMSEASKIMKAE